MSKLLEIKAGEAPFTPMTITIHSAKALRALFSAAKTAWEECGHKSDAQAVAGELMEAIDDHAEKYDIKSEYGV